MKALCRLILIFICSVQALCYAEFISVSIPSRDVVATRSTYALSGKVNKLSSLRIDGKVVTYDAKGHFSFPLKIKAINGPQTITFKALTDDYKTVTFSRQITFKQNSMPLSEKPEPESKPSNKIELISKTVTKTTTPIPKPTVTTSSTKKAASKPVAHKQTASTQKSSSANKPAVKPQETLPESPESPSPQDVQKDILQPLELIETTISPAPSTVKTLPIIFVKSPQNNLVTYENSVVLEGHVRHAREFYINNRLISLDKEGRFTETFGLTELGKSLFNLYAIGEDNLSTTVTRKVFKIEHESATTETAVKTNKKGSSEVTSKLQKKISIDLQDAELPDVVKILAEKGDLNIVSDKSLAGTVQITLSNVSIQDALDYILNTQGLSYKLIENTILIGSQDNLDRATRVETKIIRLDNVLAKDVAPILADYLKGQEKAQINEQENLLILNADSKKMPSLVDLIARLDEKKLSQIILEAQFLEVNQSSLENLGVAWSNAYGIGAQGTYTDGAFSYVSNLSISTILNLLKNNGDARILAKPRIKAVDKEPAEIFIGDNIPYIELSTDTSGRTQQSVKFIESGVLLKILPDINPFTQEIKVKFEPEVSYVNGFGGPNNDIPIVRKRKVSTVVSIKNGQTVLIGGLFNSSDSDTYSRFPLLSKIPVLGAFFRSNRTQQDQTELVIAVTPRIIDEHFTEPTANLTVGMPIETYKK